MRQTSLDNQTLRALEKRGFIELREEAVQRDPHADEQFIATTHLALNAEQTVALAAVEEALAAPENAKPILLHGVTGSGKTEIYLQAIKSALARGKTAIVLVPEISLTPQTVERFKSRFAETEDMVAVLHSRLVGRRAPRRVAQDSIGPRAHRHRRTQRRLRAARRISG